MPSQEGNQGHPRPGDAGEWVKSTGSRRGLGVEWRWGGVGAWDGNVKGMDSP